MTTCKASCIEGVEAWLIHEGLVSFRWLHWRHKYMYAIVKSWQPWHCRISLYFISITLCFHTMQLNRIYIINADSLRPQYVHDNMTFSDYKTTINSGSPTHGSWKIFKVNIKQNLSSPLTGKFRKGHCGRHSQRPHKTSTLKSAEVASKWTICFI